MGLCFENFWKCGFYKTLWGLMHFIRITFFSFTWICTDRMSQKHCCQGCRQDSHFWKAHFCVCKCGETSKFGYKLIIFLGFLKTLFCKDSFSQIFLEKTALWRIKVVDACVFRFPWSRTNWNFSVFLSVAFAVIMARRGSLSISYHPSPFFPLLLRKGWVLIWQIHLPPPPTAVFWRRRRNYFIG